MAAYFLISVLAIVLVPLTLGAAARISASESLLPSSEPHTDHPTERPEERVRGCQCTPCLDRRKQVLAKSIFNPRLTTRSVFSLSSQRIAHVSAPERPSSSSAGLSSPSWSAECATPSRTTRCTTRMKYWAFPPYVLYPPRDAWRSSVLPGYHGEGNQVPFQEAFQNIVRITVYTRRALTTCPATRTR